MKKTIVVLPGDGIGHDVMPQALRVLAAIQAQFALDLELVQGDIGGSAFDKYGEHFPAQTRALCEQADAILFGSVGGPVREAHLAKWQNCETNSILALRKLFNLNVNMRPARVYPELVDICPLRPALVNDGIDMVIFRELIGDIYFGEHTFFTQDNLRHARDTAEYNEAQIQSIAHQALRSAQQRRGKLTSVDKANVLHTSKLWREVVTETARDYPDVELEHMLVDNCAMQLLINPGQFDVIVTANLFGDILSDAAAALPGSLGLMPSASFNANGFGLYEPSGGSAPDIAGKDIANPLAQILSVALMLRYSLQHEAAAAAIEQAVAKTLAAGVVTRDIAAANKTVVGTTALTDHILKQFI